MSEAEDNFIMPARLIPIDGKLLKRSFKELRWVFMDCIHLAGDKDMVMNFNVLYKIGGEFSLQAE